MIKCFDKRKIILLLNKKAVDFQQSIAFFQLGDCHSSCIGRVEQYV